MTAAAMQPVYGVAYLCNNVPPSAPAGARLHIWLCLENRGSRIWQRSGPATDLAIFLNDEVLAMAPLPRERVGENERVTFDFPLRLPSSAGRTVLRFQLVEQVVTW